MINQGANDDEILAFKSSDVAHGMTTQTETDTYARFKKISNDSGGLRITGFSETGTTMGAILRGAVTDEETGKTSSDYAAILLSGATKTGTNFGSMSANSNIVAIANNSSTVWIADSDGDTWQDGAITAGGTSSQHGLGAANAWAPGLRIYGGTGDVVCGVDGATSTTKPHFVWRRQNSDKYDFGYDKDGDGSHNLYLYDSTNAAYRLLFDGSVINFLSNTISGTGDIYCNDIYTASGTVYIGSESISVTSPGVFDFGGATITNAPSYHKGRQELFIEYSTTSGINIQPGRIDIEDSGNEYPLLASGTIFADFSNGYTESNYVEEFTGTNGDDANPAIWWGKGTKYGGSWADPDIQGNRLHISVSSGGDQYQGIESKGTITGDFEIQIDYDITSAPNSNSWKFDFGLGETGASNDWCYIARTYTGGSDKMYVYVQDNGSMGYEVSEAVGTAPDSGKMKITWTASTTTIHFYWWNGSAWDEMGSGYTWSSIGSDAEFVITIQGNYWDSMSGTCEGYYDNFILTGEMASIPLGASTWYYVYAKPPVVGNVLSESEIELSTTEPARDVTKRGYYHGKIDCPISEQYY